MKKSIILSALVLLCAIVLPYSSQASFPVAKEAKKTENIDSKESLNNLGNFNETSSVQDTIVDEPTANNTATGGNNEMLILVLLWFFLGMFAGHRWYAGKPIGWNILFILTFGGLGIWAIVDLIHILQNKF